MKTNPWLVLFFGVLLWVAYFWLMGAFLAWVIEGPLEEILEKDVRFGALWVLSVVALVFFGRTSAELKANKSK